MPISGSKERKLSINTLKGFPSRMRLFYNGSTGKNALIGAVSLICLISVFKVQNTFSYSEFLLRSLDGPLSSENPEFLEYIRREVLIRPSTSDYNLLGESNPALKSVENSEIFYNKTAHQLFQNVRNGFFIEVGALDGETMSNTLWLEQQLGWTGLLIEADNINFEALQEKNRKAWLAKCCLSPKASPSKELFVAGSDYTPNFIFPYGKKVRAMLGLAKYTSHASGKAWYKLTQCLPLNAMINALNVKRIDLLVLDLEGIELEVLSNFNFDKVDVQVLFVECKMANKLSELHKLLLQNGFKEFITFEEDRIYVKKKSRYDIKL